MARNIQEWVDNPDLRLVDLLEANYVQVDVDESGKLWVNVDGVCVLRIGSIIDLKVEDQRRGHR